MQEVIKSWRIGNKEWRICTGGMGSLLNPPGEAESKFHVEVGDWFYSLRGALESRYTPSVVKQEIKKILKENRGDVKNEDWIRYVYMYYRGAYTKDPNDLNVNSSNCVMLGPRWNTTIEDLIAMGITPKHHLGYLRVKSFNPRHRVRMDLLPEWSGIEI